ncbi:MAG: glycosyltransferase [Candidatus Omnitrophica bacterium]|nr:glycosyltransferase [Candidatus Omnitrophota bacterium]
MSKTNKCPISLRAKSIEPYEKIVGKQVVEKLKNMSKRLKGKSWTHLNSTYQGGGVAEMLQNQIPLLRGLGIDAQWHVIEGNQKFFEVTKKFHNALQGVSQEFSLDDLFETYLGTIYDNAKKIRIEADMVTIHDPQPVAIITHARIFGHVLWRCHIDTSEADKKIWRFLHPYLNHYSGAIFTIPEFVKEDIQIPVYEIAPAIDPLHPKNKLRDRKQALNDLAALFKKNNIDPERPIIAAVSRYDIHKNQKGIIKAFKLLKKNLSSKISPLLIIMGNTASDDPEGEEMYKKMQKLAGGDKDIHLLLNVKNNDQVVGSLIHLAECFVHISTKEGFGLVVTEALWQGTPVIGSNIGGIPRQVIDKETGYLVKPDDYELVAKNMKKILEDKQLAKEMGKKGQEHVRNNYLLPHKLIKELQLMEYYLDGSKRAPGFRINDVSYYEINRKYYGRSQWPFTRKEFKSKIRKLKNA